MRIIANFYKTDKNGDIKGYKSKVIHTFNKNEYAVKDTPYNKTIKKRKNVILLGDNLGDLGMSKGITHDTIIRIGFLNDKIKELLPCFKKNYDVVILNDGPMDFVNDLIKDIIK